MPTRYVIAVLLFLMAPALCSAQYRMRSGMGLLGGPQAAAWRSEAVNYLPVAGAVVGAYVPLKIGGHLELQPELLFSLGGAAQDPSDRERSILRTVHAALPMTLKYFPGAGFNLQLGVQGGYLVWAQSDGIDIRPLLNPVDLGASVGVGVATYEGLDFALRYTQGLSNTLLDDDRLYPVSRQLRLTVGKRFMEFKYRRLRRR